MKIKPNKENIGTITRVTDLPHPRSHSWIEVDDGTKTRRLLVTQRFRSENKLKEGDQFSWKTWSLPILDFLLNPVQDVTKDFEQNPPN